MKKIIIAISPKLWDWLEKNPKKVFRYGMISIVVSLIISLVADIYFYDNDKVLLSPPKFSKKSLKYRESLNEIEKKKSNIIEEMKIFRKKQQESFLTKEDSLRVKFLNKQYNELRNGHKRN